MSRRVLHLIPSLAGGGAERQLALLAPAIAALGIDVHVGLLSGGTHLQRLSAAGVTVHTLPARGHYDPALAWDIRRLTRTTGAGVVQTWLPLMDVWGGIGARLARRAWVLSERSVATAYVGSARYRARERVGRFADVVVANSAAGASYWRGCGMPAARCIVVPNAVSVADVDRAQIPPDLDALTGGRPLVLAVGRLSEEKNAARLIEALALAAPQAEFVALLCGEGPLDERLRAQIAARGLTERVKLAGFRDDVWGLMKGAAMLVSVSHFEGRPNAVLEAMAAGCPLVVSDIPAHREFLDPQTARFVPTGDAVAIAAAIVEQLASPEAARRRARGARAAIDPFDTAMMAARYLALYDGLMERRARGNKIVEAAT